MDDLIERARLIAHAYHRTQVRKYTGDPYTVHLEEVALFLELVGMRPTVIAAGWIHDLFEDTNACRSEMRRLLGAEVVGFALQVTDVSRPEDGNRAVRKAKDREHLAASSAEGATIKLADLISNTCSIVRHDPDFAKVYIPEKLALLPLLRHGHGRLWTVADGMVRAAAQELALA